jgi:MoxR-like ATPase
LALCQGRRFAIPDDVQRLAIPVLGHRVVLRHAAGMDTAREAIERVVAAQPVPV